MIQASFSPRQAEILAAARRDGAASISALAAALGVSLETVRRDIRALVDDGHLVKKHGTVHVPDHGREAPFDRRMRENAAEKRRIARHVARLIADGDSIMMDTGTTTSILARELAARRELTIVTNSSDVARTLATVNGNKVFMAGGELHGDNGAAFGRTAIDFAARFRVRHAIISIGAIDARMGPMDYLLEEAEFARTVLSCGDNRILATDHTKFDRSALVKVCDFADFDLLVADRPPPAAIADALGAAGGRFEVAAD
ncbi:DeoR/GlpR family DNA-binding transcription regulator [Aquibium carbonis]|uniref:DeoR/GlpR family DNA-binding transcription regulator n=1 Tax=Aquibium carbonis TaxID=2495581 RepID=UPI001FE1D7C6|nr:DeoR/GlpR family DNA-binding transcription regulator [Aquibium carbonis]